MALKQLFIPFAHVDSLKKPAALQVDSVGRSRDLQGLLQFNGYCRHNCPGRKCIASSACDATGIHIRWVQPHDTGASSHEHRPPHPGLLSWWKTLVLLLPARTSCITSFPLSCPPTRNQSSLVVCTTSLRTAAATTSTTINMTTDDNRTNYQCNNQLLIVLVL